MDEVPDCPSLDGGIFIHSDMIGFQSDMLQACTQATCPIILTDSMLTVMVIMLIMVILMIMLIKMIMITTVRATIVKMIYFSYTV